MWGLSYSCSQMSVRAVAIFRLYWAVYPRGLFTCLAVDADCWLGTQLGLNGSKKAQPLQHCGSVVGLLIQELVPLSIIIPKESGRSCKAFYNTSLEITWHHLRALFGSSKYKSCADSRGKDIDPASQKQEWLRICRLFKIANWRYKIQTLNNYYQNYVMKMVA